jgi:anti-anti-sigma regulatory factor
MAEGENRSGLLSKMVKFVRNPTKDWAELDQKEVEGEKGYSKEVLKEMIERKRQNDFVRKREFDHLRKLRRREPITGLDRGGRPSFFNSSFTSNHDDRAMTLKKIDEIEAQMSRQWWKSKEGHVSVPGDSSDAMSRVEAGATLPPSMVPPRVARPAPTQPADDSYFAPTAASDMEGEVSSFWDDDVNEEARAAMPPREAAPTVPMDFRHEALVTRSAPVGAGFASQRLYAHAPTENLTDPELEDAAIRFANGDIAGAEASLMAALESNADRPDLADLWMSALFDLYRATGQQARFDQAAMDFANRYGRSAPAWVSMPELVQRPTGDKPAVAAKPAATDGTPADWTCPAHLQASDLDDVRALLRIAGPVVLDWQGLTTVMPDAVPGLADMVASWCDSQAMLVFRGHASLERALQALTPSGDRTVEPLCWRLRMDALRVMKLIDTFELVALDYCVTFEVSPPSWQEARCHCELQGLSDPAEAEAEDIRSHWHDHSTWEDSLRHPSSSSSSPLDDQSPATVELSGEILGDANEVLVRLEKGLENSSRLVVSCARLIRVDFSAAGSILNWAAMQQSLGRQIQFRDVNRMVAAFFNVIGISEHARVVPRAV